jgi:hypothetical protein
MGVGNADIRAKRLGRCELNFGIGKANVTLIGSADRYKLDVEKGIGKVTVDDSEYGSNTVIGNGENILDIECGIGEVNVSFK